MNSNNRYYLLLSLVLQTFMGIFYNIHSVALIEDLPLEHKYDTPQEFFSAANNSYKQVKHWKCPVQIIHEAHDLAKFVEGQTDIIGKANKLSILFCIPFLECTKLLDSCLHLFGHIGCGRSTILCKPQHRRVLEHPISRSI